MGRPARILRSKNAISDVTTFLDVMTNDPRVEVVKIEINKRTGVVRANARSADGHVITKELLGPGLVRTTHYDSTENGTDERDHNILKLLDAGYTQVEVALQIGCSQALVSKVKNSRR